MALYSQLCNGVDENAVGTSAELIFAPIDASFSDDAPILPSGFRIIPLDSGMVNTLKLNLLFSPFHSLQLCSFGYKICTFANSAGCFKSKPHT